MSAPAADAKKPVLSAQGWAWLIFFGILLIASLVLYFVFPDLVIWKTDPNGPRGRIGGFRRLLNMEREEIPMVVLVVSWIVGPILWVYWFRTKRRREGLQLVCDRLGLNLQPNPATGEWSKFEIFPLFQVGSNPTALNMMTGTFAGFPIVVLDYTFQMDLDMFGTKQDYNQTVVIFVDGAPDAPDFQLLSRESMWSNTGGKSKRKGQARDLGIGGKENGSFAKAYQVDSEFKAKTRRFFSPALMSFFTTYPVIDVEAARGDVLVYRERTTVKPHALIDFLKEASKVVAALQMASSESAE
jgi:hypothetical protein